MAGLWSFDIIRKMEVVGAGTVVETRTAECGEPGHFARECRLRIGSRGLGSGRRCSPSPRRRGSPVYGRRSYSPRGRRSPPRRGRSYSRSPPYRRSVMIPLTQMEIKCWDEKEAIRKRTATAKICDLV